jgi:hypothetical protein
LSLALVRTIITIVAVFGTIAGIILVLLGLGVGFMWLGEFLNSFMPGLGNLLSGWGAIFIGIAFLIIAITVIHHLRR